MAAILNFDFRQEPYFCHRGSHDFSIQRTKIPPGAKFYASFRKCTHISHIYSTTMKNLIFIKFKMADLRPLPIDKFSHKRDSLNIFFLYRYKIYTITSISLIARMSSKLGKIRTKNRSWRSKWPIIGHYFFNMRNIWKTGPDS